MPASGKFRNVAFIGLGDQGAPLACNLLTAGYHLSVFDKRPEAMQEPVALGARAAASPADAAREATIAFICVNTDDQLLDVVNGSDGMLASIAAGGIIVVNSTVGPQTVAAIVATAAERDVEVVDAPLTGGRAGAIGKTVLYIVGGSDRAVAQCLPLLEVSARQIIRAGETGAGVRAKLVHQLILCGNLLAAREGWALGLGAGLAPQVLVDVIRNGAAQSRIAEALPSRVYSPHIADLYRKDLALCLTFGEELGIELPGASLTADVIDILTLGARPNDAKKEAQ